MTSLGNAETAAENHSTTLNDCIDAEYIVDEREAKEINSCLNFLSILDEETSNDSCDFTLFRKKDDTPVTKSERKESTDIKICDDMTTEETIKHDSDTEIGKEDVDTKNIHKVKSSKEVYEIVKKIATGRPNCESLKLKPTPKTRISPNFKVTSIPGPKIFKISTISDETVSKRETTSIIRSANNIVLKVPRAPSKLNDLSLDENDSNFLHFKKNDAVKETDLQIISKPLSKMHNSLKLEGSNIIKVIPNSITPRKLKGLKSEEEILKGETSRKKVAKSSKVELFLPSLISSHNTSNHMKYAQIVHKKFKKQKVSTLLSGQEVCSSEINKNEKNDLIDTITREKPTSDFADVEENNLGLNSPLPVSKKINSQLDIPNQEFNSVFNRPKPSEIINSVTDSPLQVINSRSDCPAEKLDVKSKLNCSKTKFKIVPPKKKIKVRVLDGRYKNKKRRYQKEIDLLKGSPPPIKAKESKRKEKLQKNKYTPLIRTELPTFLKKLESHGNNKKPNEPDNSSSAFEDDEYTNNKSYPTDIEEINKTSNEKATWKEDNEVNDGLLLKKDDSFVNKETEASLSITFPPVLHAEMNNLTLPSEEELAYIKAIKKNLPSTVNEHEIWKEKFLAYCTATEHLNSDFKGNLLGKYKKKDLQENNFPNEIPFQNFLDLPNTQSQDSLHSLYSPPVEVVNVKPSTKELLRAKESVLSEETLISENNLTREHFSDSDLSKESEIVDVGVLVSPALSDTEGSKTNGDAHKSEELVKENVEKRLKGEKEKLPEEKASSVYSCSRSSPVSFSGHKDGMEKLPLDHTHSEQKTPTVIYSYNKSSPLSFSVQNILENMFKHENFPSSTNMARLAKIMEVQWRDVRDWFVARRHLNKKNGIFPRNQPLTTCPYCPEYHSFPNERAVVHLLSKEHIQNMMKCMQRDNLIFSKFQIGNKKLGKHETEIENASTIKELDPKSVSNTLTDICTDKLNEPETLCDHPITVFNSHIDKPKCFKPKRMKPLLSPLHSEVKPTTMTDHAHEKIDGFFEVQTDSSSKFKVSDPCVIDGNKRLRESKSLYQMDTKIYIGYRCPECCKIFQSEWMLIRHSISHKKLICSECNEVFLREDLLQHHFKEHLIESMDDELYSMYLCFKCYSLNCVCVQDTHYVPSVSTKHYLRPQRAKRSKPFISAPYTGVNEHLKVTMKEFWHEFKAFERNSALYREKRGNVQDNLPKKEKKNKVETAESNATPTYTNITTFNCDMCESFFFTQDELKEHVIVHRIQARNRSKKRQTEEDGKNTSDSEFLKPSAPLDPLYFCSYCKKGYKKESTLYKHLKFECKSLPRNIFTQISNGSSFLLEKTRKCNHYRIKMKTPTSPTRIKKLSVKPSEAKCQFCSYEFLSNENSKHHLLICQGKKADHINIDDEKNLESEDEPDSFPDDEENKTFYFLCAYCSIPLTSEKQLRLHIAETCNNAPKKVKVELLSHTLFELERLGKGVHFKRIKKDSLSRVLPPRKLRSIVDISTFPTANSNFRRVKCKFCSKYPLKSCLKVHLFQQCKNVPKEIRNIMEGNKSYLFGRNFNKSLPGKKSKAICDIRRLPATNVNKLNIEVPETNDAKCLTNEVLSETHTDEAFADRVSQCSQSVTETDMLYDCHLCEEKFKVSKDFISHMSHFHCMKISEDSSYKWLSHVNMNQEDSAQRSEKGSPPKTPETHHHHDENVFEQDANLESIAETLLVSDYAALEKNECDLFRPAISSPLKRGESLSPSKESPNKSQKMDDDELLGDLDNLDSFVETVQLEDINFTNSSL